MQIVRSNASKVPVFATLGEGSRVIHKRYGRGKLTRLFADDGQGSVNFDEDGGHPRRVMLRDLEREPSDMPPDVLGNRAVLS